MEINLKKIIEKPEFLQILASEVCERKDIELEKEWGSAFLNEFQKQLEIEVKETVKNWIEDDSENIKDEIERTLRQMSKTEIIELLKNE